MNRKLFGALICIGTAFAGSTRPSSDPEMLDEEVGLFLKADSSTDLAKSYHRLFDNAGAEELRLLVAHPDCGVALAAAWQRVRRTVPLEELEDSVSVDKNALSRFLGLVEGRVQVPLPRLWEMAVLSAGSFGGRRAWFPIRQVLDVEPDLKMARPVSVECEGARCVVTVEDKKLSLPYEPGFGSVDQASVEFMKEKAYIALYSSSPSPYRLHAVDKDTGKVSWSVRVWAAGNWGGYSGSGKHEVELMVHGDVLTVFGVSSVIYIETFDTKTGKNLWRFGSRYFEYKPTK